MNCKRSFCTALLALALGAISPLVRAADVSWNVAGPADWSVPANWDTATVPGAADHAHVSNGGTANITSDVGTVIYTTVQDSTVNQTGGKLIVAGETFAGGLQ